MENSTNNVAQATQEAATIAQNAISSQPKTVSAVIIQVPSKPLVKKNGKMHYLYNIEFKDVAGNTMRGLAFRNVNAQNAAGEPLTVTDTVTGEVTNVENKQPKLGESVQLIPNVIDNNGVKSIVYTITMAIQTTPADEQIAALKALGIL